MRPTEKELSSIRTCAGQVFGHGCTVRLFGSRAPGLPPRPIDAVALRTGVVLT